MEGSRITDLPMCLLLAQPFDPIWFDRLTDVSIIRPYRDEVSAPDVRLTFRWGAQKPDLFLVVGFPNFPVEVRAVFKRSNYARVGFGAYVNELAAMHDTKYVRSIPIPGLLFGEMHASKLDARLKEADEWARALLEEEYV